MNTPKHRAEGYPYATPHLQRINGRHRADVPMEPLLPNAVLLGADGCEWRPEGDQWRNLGGLRASYSRVLDFCGPIKVEHR